MNPVNFPEANLTLGPPEGWTEDQCNTIKVWKGVDSEGRPCFLSCWELTDEEIGALMLGEKLFVRILGESAPPIGVQIGSPFQA